MRIISAVALAAAHRHATTTTATTARVANFDEHHRGTPASVIAFQHLDESSPRWRKRSMHVLLRLVLLAVVWFSMSALPADAADSRTVVSHGFTHTEFFPDDICGPRASTVTFKATMSQSQFIERRDGGFSFRDVAVVTSEVDFLDPALADYRDRLVEVNHFVLTPGDNTFVVANTFHDFGGGLKIWERLNVKVVNGEVLVDRGLLQVSGCP